MALASLDLVKGVLGIPVGVTKHDTRLQAALAAAERGVLNALGLTTDAVTAYTVWADADDDPAGYDLVQFGPRPVVLITELRDYSVVIDPDNYRLIANVQVRRYHARWSGVRQNGVHPFGADITAGFDTVPDDLALGVAQWAADIYSHKPGRVKSERIGRYAVTRAADGELPPWPTTLQMAMAEYDCMAGLYIPIALPE